ncbi:MAG: LytR family transcriptional regulator [Chloroflexi bacterium]|nr:MAG: LytR family transcriptional regulator [Chloroflexota bacterium]TMG68522.1 MAG: LytR family transcriptional regulator [Chloroflexota bacterium]
MPRALIVALGFILAGLGGLGAYFLPVFQTAANSTSASDGLPNLNPISAPTQPFTVLLLGSDDDAKFVPERLNTQSMILVRIDPNTKQATMLSIPRDLWVQIPNQGWGKISWAYQEGGTQGAIAAVESNFQVHVDDYVWIGLNGLVRLVDKLGGVNLQVTNPVMDNYYPADLNTTDPYGYYRVAVLPGATHMDGVHALQYVRSRHGDARGDFARSERQQQLLLSIKAEAAHLNAADLPSLAGAFNGEIKTSIGLDKARALISIANDFSGPSVHRIVLVPPYTSDGWVAGQSVLLPDWNQIRPLVHKSFS